MIKKPETKSHKSGPKVHKPETKPSANRPNQEKVSAPGRKPPPKDTRFKPGQSGNPSGRPSLRPITDAYRRMLDKPIPGDKDKRTYGEAIATRLLEMAMSKDGDKALRAAVEICDRLEGKSVARSEFSGPNGKPIEIQGMENREQNEKRISELLAAAKPG